MKKTILDLKIGDSMWLVESTNEPIEMKVDSLSKTEITFIGNRVHHQVSVIDDSDRTCWVIKCGYSHSRPPYSKNIYTERIDALKEIRNRLDSQMKNIFERQQKFYESISIKNNEIRVCDLEISKELKK